MNVSSGECAWVDVREKRREQESEVHWARSKQKRRREEYEERREKGLVNYL